MAQSKNKAQIEPRPFLKWVGGKSQLINIFKSNFIPPDYNDYYEPFVGGGAFLFALKPQKAFINDVNKTLVYAYKNIKKNPDRIILLLDSLQKVYQSKTEDEQKDLYYQIREKYNNLPDQSEEKTAYLIFLNKTSFNGIYRTNSQDKFNVPFGKHRNPLICDTNNITLASKLLRKVSVTYGDFEQAVDKANKGDFIYFDPPYHPIESKNKNKSFTKYTCGNFGEEEQLKLKELFVNLNKRGCFVMLSNSYTDFIKDLYKGFRQEIVQANRAVNCKAYGRGKINELVILNY